MILARLLSCVGKDGTETETDSDVDADTDTDTDGDTDTEVCDVSALSPYVALKADEVDVQLVLPGETARDGETITDFFEGHEKRHVIARLTDDAARRGELFVWLPGSGGEPENYRWIISAALFAGYDVLSLAYDNETSVADQCGIVGDPVCDADTNLDCEEQVREEVVYGEVAAPSPCAAVSAADAIENRVTRAVQYMADRAPAAGFDAYLDGTGEALDWTHVAVGGWSQGGGHAGILARDFLVARALFVSKGAGAVACTQVATEAECDLDGDGVVGDGEMIVPAPWASQPRATPASREFGSIHREEDAWLYSRKTFAGWDMAGADDPVDIDALGAYPDAWEDYGCTNVISTDAVPECGDGEFHKSMATDRCVSLDGSGVPVLMPAWLYFLGVPVP